MALKQRDRGAKTPCKWCSRGGIYRYALKSELDAKYYEYSVIPSDDYVKLKEYAQIYELNYENLLIDVRKGRYQSAIKNGKYWYIDKKENPCFVK